MSTYSTNVGKNCSVTNIEDGGNVGNNMSDGDSNEMGKICKMNQKGWRCQLAPQLCGDKNYSVINSESIGKDNAKNSIEEGTEIREMENN